jgi:DNA replication protein DnaC
MAFLSIIRRWHLREHVPIREISQRTGVSRNTIRRYLRLETVEPKFRVPDRPSKLDPYAEKLSAWLRREVVRQLHRCEFIDPTDNVVLVGGPGAGKRQVATAIGVQAIKHHKRRVRFFSIVELVNTLEQEKV